MQSRTWMELYKNADYVCSIYEFYHAGNSVLLHLNENDVISIRSHASTNTTLYGTLDQIYTTFTEVFLNPDITGKTSYLYHNYHYIDSLFGGSDEEFATESNAAALNLVAENTVFLKSKRSTKSYYGAPDQVYCTFSGYILDLLEELTIVDPGVIIC